MENEKRLIDANGSYRLGADDYTGCAISFNDGIITVTNDDGCYICEFDAKKLPTVDAVEVVHGRWRWCGSDRWNDAYQCSNCGKIAMNDSNYCPNCGAKMDGGK